MVRSKSGEAANAAPTATFTGILLRPKSFG
ncbi:Uncharacterised protein [Mycobacteroides abscessus subsp. abscessus]|nr:Uncharacterised protein [Mycobacteroides abscessus subsp. abscessus]